MASFKTYLTPILLFSALCLLYFASIPTISFKAQNDAVAKIWEEAQQFKAPAPPSLNSVQRAKARLGEKLFHDKRFSHNGKISCTSCHDPKRYFTDGRARSIGLKKGTKNTSTVVNSYMGRWFFWNGRADSLLSQALMTVESHSKHGVTRSKVAYLMGKYYREEYEEIYGQFPEELLEREYPPMRPSTPPPPMSREMLEDALKTITSEKILHEVKSITSNKQRPRERVLAQLLFPTKAKTKANKSYDTTPTATRTKVERVFTSFGDALQAFQMRITAIQSPFDVFLEKWQRNTPPEAYFSGKFGVSEFEGLTLFVGKGKCILCHGGPHFSDNQFHNIGLSTNPKLPVDLGRATGVLEVINAEFNCKHPLLKATSPENQEGHTCQTLPFLDTDNETILGAFKTPTLRNTSMTPPYFHDGRAPMLMDVINHYNTLETLPSVGHMEETLTPIRLNLREKRSLVSFLESLTSEISIAY